MRNIQQAIQEHKNKVLELYPEYQILGVFVYGSQNYGLATDKSDVDTKAVIVPTIKQLALHPVKTRTLELDNGEHCEVMDIMHLVSNFKKQNINFVEILFTPNYWLNPNYAVIWNDFFSSYAEEIATYNPDYCLKSICGQAIHTLKQGKTDGKKVGNGFRLRQFLMNYFDETIDSYADCIVFDDNMRDFILEIKYKTLENTDMADSLIEWFEVVKQGIVTVDKEKQKLIDNKFENGIMELIRRCDTLRLRKG